MTEEQFKQIMDKLEEIKRAQQPNYIGHPSGPNPFLPRLPQYPKPQPWNPWDDGSGLPAHWGPTRVTD